MGCSAQHNDFFNRTIKLELIELGDDCHLFCRFLNAHLFQGFPIKGNQALIRLFLLIEEFQQTSLPTSIGSQNRMKLVALQFERHSFENLFFSDSKVDILAH